MEARLEDGSGKCVRVERLRVNDGQDFPNHDLHVRSPGSPPTAFPARALAHGVSSPVFARDTEPISGPIFLAIGRG